MGGGCLKSTTASTVATASGGSSDNCLLSCQTRSSLLSLREASRYNQIAASVGRPACRSQHNPATNSSSCVRACAKCLTTSWCISVRPREVSAGTQSARSRSSVSWRRRCRVEAKTPENAVINCRCAIAKGQAGRMENLLGVPRSRCSLIANCRPAFDAAAHFNRGDTMSFALPTAVPAHSLVCLGPNLILTRFNCTGLFSECFISSATDTSKHDKTPVALCLRQRRLLSPVEHGATVCNLTDDKS